MTTRAMVNLVYGLERALAGDYKGNSKEYPYIAYADAVRRTTNKEARCR